MTPERFREIEQLAQAALQQPASARSRFLVAECRDDPSLRLEVEQLLESYGRAESFLEVPAVVAVEDLADVPLPPAEGLWPEGPADRRIGPYEVIREIGHGGMGTVYLAARRGDYHRQVAIKLLRPGMRTDEVVRRFRSERQILSSLDHPHIAKLFEGGTTRDGRPYFVMEYIDGVPLDVFCDRHRLPIRERLELYMKVCSAVQYAHRNLVVHRDIKPSNILVTGDGEPKLLDFGIAKILDPEAFPMTVDVTESGLRPMTPHYASPEQISGSAVTTASDVYSLGVLLYELLTGQRPYRLTGLAPGKMERVLQSEPLKPSTAVSEPPPPETDSSSGAASHQRGTDSVGLYRQLTGDLDNIVLMALRREPERRYPSVDHFSEDIRRHLRGLPVVARQDHFGYRLGKFLRRNKLAVAAVATIAILVVGSAIATAYQASQIARQRDIAEIERRQAEIERDKARRVSDFLVEIFEVTDPNSALDADIKAREVLDRAAESIGEKLQDQPEIDAALRHALGRVYKNLGFDDQARPLFEDAVRLRREAYGSEHPEVASSLHHLATTLSGEPERARALVQQAIELRQAGLGENHPLVAESLILLSQYLHETLDGPAAIAAIERAIAILGQQGEESLPHLARAYQRLGYYLSAVGNHDRAVSLIRESVELGERVYGPEHPELAISFHSLANAYLRAGDYEQAGPMFLRALEINRKAFGDEHPRVAANLTNLGIVYRKRGDYQQAETVMRQALEFYKGVFGEESRSVFSSLNSLAILAYYQGDLEQAEDYLLWAAEVVRKTREEDDPLMAFVLNNLGLVYREQGNDAAESVLLRSLEIRKGFENQNLADDTRNNLASVYLLDGRMSEARGLYESVRDSARERFEENPGNRPARTNLAAAHLGLGKLFQAAGDDERAAESWQRTAELMAPLTVDRESLEFQDTHAVALLYLGRVEEARPLVEELASKNWLGADFLRLCRRANLRCGSKSAPLSLE